MNGSNRVYRYLDGDTERHALIADIRRVRQAVLQIAESTPEARRFEPRYHGVSLAGLLAHLYLMDRLAFWTLQWALLGIRPPLPMDFVRVVNDAAERVFQQRVIETTIRGIMAQEKRITDFIRHLPMDRFTREVYDPTSEAYLTVERAVQVFFLFHWQEHLAEMQRAEGIFTEPPERFDTM